ncbi:amino acid ABC transporter substrate-binding protein [Methyloceanibacter caenitepidi]|uniref:Branched-chain amino acid ABC transporter, amino acid-binding protein n=1 Tax=Methyloceanibacter caenitepidi TaxID=1384459 RepID=A0A0A8K371_9HYPH|nr:amino acid ABC transporter substrate-binding protein [Methyloceanibacter caenitepidi]BAQ17355.1 branched-chain amino acid ABC transporter, amino acid-binding protein [Methyloceanibacter caenitepidi]
MAAAFFAVSAHVWGVADASDDEVVLGTTLPLTGAHRRSGANTKNGYELAIRQVNGRGGIVVRGKRYRLKARYYDDNSDPLQAQELIDRLIHTDGVKFILGPYHGGQNRAVLTTIERNRVPMVDAHSVPRKQGARGSTYSFAVAATPDQYFTPALEFAAAFAEKFGKAANGLRIGMATEDDTFSREVRAGILSDVRRLGIACIIDDQLPENFESMAATLDKVKKLKPDIFLVSGHDETAVTAVTEIEKSGAGLPMVAVTHCETARLAQSGNRSSNFVFCPVQWDRAAKHKGALFGTSEEFARLYEKTFNDEPTSVAAQAAAAVYVFADAFKRAQSFEPEEVRDAISATDLDTFFGHIKFDAQGTNSKKSLMLTQIIDGDYVLIAPHAWAEQEPVITKPAVTDQAP